MLVWVAIRIGHNLTRSVHNNVILTIKKKVIKFCLKNIKRLKCEDSYKKKLFFIKIF